MIYKRELKLYSVPLYLIIAYDNTFRRIIIKELGRVIVSKKLSGAIDYSTENMYRVVSEIKSNRWGDLYIEPPKWFDRNNINTFFIVDKRNFDESHLASADEVVNYLANPNPNWIEIYEKNLVTVSPEQQYINKITGRM